jgi:hypothetical protein
MHLSGLDAGQVGGIDSGAEGDGFLRKAPLKSPGRNSFADVRLV